MAEGECPPKNQYAVVFPLSGPDTRKAHPRYPRQATHTQPPIRHLVVQFSSIICRHGERRPNQEQALHDVVKRGDRRESEAATGALAEPEGPGERAGRRVRGKARRGAKEEDTVFGS